MESIVEFKKANLSSDDLANVSKQRVNATTVKILDAITNEPKPVQVMSLVASIWLLLKTSNLHLSNALDIVENMSRDEKHSMRMNATFAGLIYYLQKNIFKTIKEE